MSCYNNGSLLTHQELNLKFEYGWQDWLLGIGDHRCLMTLYQIQVIGTQGFTCQDEDTGVMLIT